MPVCESALCIMKSMTEGWHVSRLLVCEHTHMNKHYTKFCKCLQEVYMLV